MRIRPGKAAFESTPPDIDKPSPRAPFMICTRKVQSAREEEKSKA